MRTAAPINAKHPASRSGAASGAGPRAKARRSMEHALADVAGLSRNARITASIGSVTFLLALPHLAYAQEEASGQGVVGNTILETLQRGGSVMYVILVLSIVGLAVILEMAYRTRQSITLPKHIIKALEDPDTNVAVDELIGDNPKTGICRFLQAGRLWKKGTNEQVQAAIEEAVDEALWRYRKGIRPLGVIATTAPLLGLLGTVIGIIQAFDVVARKGALGDPGALAGGISKALLTTCFGLIVGIPVLLAYHYLNGRIEARLRHCEELAKKTLILPPE